MSLNYTYDELFGDPDKNPFATVDKDRAQSQSQEQTVTQEGAAQTNGVLPRPTFRRPTWRRNPYEEFSSEDFDNFITSIKTKLKNALSGNFSDKDAKEEQPQKATPEPQSQPKPQPQKPRERKRFKDSVNWQRLRLPSRAEREARWRRQAGYDDQEPQQTIHVDLPAAAAESESDASSARSISSMEQRLRSAAKGKARDPAEGPGLGPGVVRIIPEVDVFDVRSDHDEEEELYDGREDHEAQEGRGHGEDEEEGSEEEYDEDESSEDDAEGEEEDDDEEEEGEDQVAQASSSQTQHHQHHPVTPSPRSRSPSRPQPRQRFIGGEGDIDDQFDQEQQAQEGDDKAPGGLHFTTYDFAKGGEQPHQFAPYSAWLAGQMMAVNTQVDNADPERAVEMAGGPSYMNLIQEPEEAKMVEDESEEDEDEDPAVADLLRYPEETTDVDDSTDGEGEGEKVMKGRASPPTPLLADPWQGPQMWAEDYYSGGDRLAEGVTDPSALVGALEVEGGRDQRLQPREVLESGIIDVDLEDEDEKDADLVGVAEAENANAGVPSDWPYWNVRSNQADEGVLWDVRSDHLTLWTPVQNGNANAMTQEDMHTRPNVSNERTQDVYAEVKEGENIDPQLTASLHTDRPAPTDMGIWDPMLEGEDETGSESEESEDEDEEQKQRQEGGRPANEIMLKRVPLPPHPDLPQSAGPDSSILSSGQSRPELGEATVERIAERAVEVAGAGISHEDEADVGEVEANEIVQNAAKAAIDTAAGAALGAERGPSEFTAPHTPFDFFEDEAFRRGTNNAGGQFYAAVQSLRSDDEEDEESAEEEYPLDLTGEKEDGFLSNEEREAFEELVDTEGWFKANESAELEGLSGIVDDSILEVEKLVGGSGNQDGREGEGEEYAFFEGVAGEGQEAQDEGFPADVAALLVDVDEVSRKDAGREDGVSEEQASSVPVLDEKAAVPRNQELLSADFPIFPNSGTTIDDVGSRDAGQRITSLMFGAVRPTDETTPAVEDEVQGKPGTAGEMSDTAREAVQAEIPVAASGESNIRFTLASVQERQSVPPALDYTIDVVETDGEAPREIIEVAENDDVVSVSTSVDSTSLREDGPQEYSVEEDVSVTSEVIRDQGLDFGYQDEGAASEMRQASEVTLPCSDDRTPMTPSAQVNESTPVEEATPPLSTDQGAAEGAAATAKKETDLPWPAPAVADPDVPDIAVASVVRETTPVSPLPASLAALRAVGEEATRGLFTPEGGNSVSSTPPAQSSIIGDPLESVSGEQTASALSADTGATDDDFDNLELLYPDDDELGDADAEGEEDPDHLSARGTGSTGAPVTPAEHEIQPDVRREEEEEEEEEDPFKLMGNDSRYAPGAVAMPEEEEESDQGEPPEPPFQYPAVNDSPYVVAVSPIPSMFPTNHHGGLPSPIGTPKRTSANSDGDTPALPSVPEASSAKPARATSAAATASASAPSSRNVIRIPPRVSAKVSESSNDADVPGTPSRKRKRGAVPAAPSRLTRARSKTEDSALTPAMSPPKRKKATQGKGKAPAHDKRDHASKEAIWENILESEEATTEPVINVGIGSSTAASGSSTNTTSQAEEIPSSMMPDAQQAPIQRHFVLQHDHKKRGFVHVEVPAPAPLPKPASQPSRSPGPPSRPQSARGSQTKDVQAQDPTAETSVPAASEVPTDTSVALSGAEQTQDEVSGSTVVDVPVRSSSPNAEALQTDTTNQVHKRESTLTPATTQEVLSQQVSKSPSPPVSKPAEEQRPSDPASSETRATVQPHVHSINVDYTSPVTRSNCRFHNISLPREEDGPRAHFVIPGCALTDKELMEEEDIIDHGEATVNDQTRLQDDIETLDFMHEELLGVLRQLIGLDLVREGEILYLPQPGEEVGRKQRRKSTGGRLSTISNLGADSPRISVRPNLFSSQAGSSRGETVSVSSRSARQSTRVSETASNYSEGDVSYADDENGSSASKRRKLSPAEDAAPPEASASDTMVEATGQDFPVMQTEHRDSVPTRRSRRLGRDAMAYKPSKESEQGSSGETELAPRHRRKRTTTAKGAKRAEQDEGQHKDETKKNKGVKRSRSDEADAVDEKAPQTKKLRARTRTKSNNARTKGDKA